MIQNGTNEMKSGTEWYELIESATYDDAVAMLLDKYGRVDQPYFVNENCATKNKRCSRADVGLQVHHIKENEIELLSDKYVAQDNPWEYQLPENLVYCNPLEHLLLHIKLYVKPNKRKGIEEQHKGGIVFLTRTCAMLYNDMWNEESRLSTDRAKNQRKAIEDGEDFFYRLACHTKNKIVYEECGTIMNAKTRDEINDGYMRSIISGRKMVK